MSFDLLNKALRTGDALIRYCQPKTSVNIATVTEVGAKMGNKSGTGNQMEAARKEIRASIRHMLGTERLWSLQTLPETMDQLLAEYENHPINKLFKLGRLDITNPDHWRALTFIMVDEIFGFKSPGAPSKTDHRLKNFELLGYMNMIQTMRAEEGQKPDVVSAARDLPVLFAVIEKGKDETRKDIVQRYKGLKVATLQRYVKSALTDGEALLRAEIETIDLDLAEIISEALDNFRPGWKQAKELK